MIISNIQTSGTCSSGTFSVNTQYLRGLCHQIIVKPVSESTIYDIKIVNSINAIVYERTSETGTISESIQMPLRGIYTISINNSTSDEYFIIQVVLEE